MENNYTVYMHISPSGKRYIGITCQKPKYRWNNGKGYKEQVFYNAIEKYGWENFEHIIIAKGLTEEEADWLETELIKELDLRNPDKGYNITEGGEGTKGMNPRDYMTEETKRKKDRKQSEKMKGENNPNYGKHPSEETRKKLSEAKKGKYCGKNSPRAKSVIVIINGKIFRVFDYVTQGAEYFSCSKGHISDCCKGKYKYCGKYNGIPLIWKYIDIIEL